MNYSELLQLAKGWSNFVSARIHIWRLVNSTLKEVGFTFLIVVMRQFTTKSAYHIEKMEKYGRIGVLHDNILEGQLQSALKMPTSLIIRRFLEIT